MEVTKEMILKEAAKRNCIPNGDVFNYKDSWYYVRLNDSIVKEINEDDALGYATRRDSTCTMNDVLTIMKTRKMSKVKIETNLSERVKKLENLGMDHVSACEFISSVMNLGIAAQEQW